MRQTNKKNLKNIHFAALAADTILFTIKDNVLLVRLIKVNRPPYFLNIPGLPGGLLDPKETAEQAALRHLQTKALHVQEGNISKNIYIEQLYTFSDVKRDPRNRVVAVAYLALTSWQSLPLSQQQNSADAFWMPAEHVPKLAYDHNQMLATAIIRLRSRITYTTLISKLMPAQFTLTELEKTYESILHTDLDKRNFRKKIFKLNIVKKLALKRSTERSRPASLYQFKSTIVQEMGSLTKK